jgi:alpha-beta hydrolase superfamily lysophospholipase
MNVLNTIAKQATLLRDYLQAQYSYQLFITPLPLPVEEEYKDFANKACAFMNTHRSNLIIGKTPRHHVLHHFAQPNNPQAKKILIAHGWMSRAAYMGYIIRGLHKRGYEIYALDFPAHGDAHGWQLPWIDAVGVLKETLNNHGPFYGVLGHSFGGSMLLSTLNLSKQLPQWHLHQDPERMILLASPTNMSNPISKLARKLKLSSAALMHLRELIQDKAETSLSYLDARRLNSKTKIPILCIHGNQDGTVEPEESISFCRKYKNASLVLLPELDHVSVLIDYHVEKSICDFLR